MLPLDLQTTNDRAFKIAMAFRKAEVRKNKFQSDKLFDDLWEVCRGSLSAYSGIKKFASHKWPLEDLMQMLRLGLLQAAREFELGRGPDFIECACVMAKNSLLQYLGEFNETIKQSAYLTRSRKVLGEYTEALVLALGRQPTEDEVCAATLDLQDARMVNFALKNPPTCTVDYDSLFKCEPTDGTDTCLNAVLESEQRQAVREAWQSWIAALTPSQAERLTALYPNCSCGRQDCEPRSYKEAGNILGCNTKSVDNGIVLAKTHLRRCAEEILAQRGLTIETASVDDILALRFAQHR